MVSPQGDVFLDYLSWRGDNFILLYRRIFWSSELAGEVCDSFEGHGHVEVVDEDGGGDDKACRSEIENSPDVGIYEDVSDVLSLVGGDGEDGGADVSFF